MLVRSLQLKRLLSFGPDAGPVELGPLNVLIGPNGSGKSNFLEAIGLLHAAPGDLARPVREGGGVGAWLWQGEVGATAEIEAVLEHPASPGGGLRHRIAFAEVGQRLELVDERIESAQPRLRSKKPAIFYGHEGGRPMLHVNGRPSPRLSRQDIDPQRSILAQRKDPEQYPELAFISDAYEQIRLHREWTFGAGAAPRRPQPTDLPSAYLLPDARNLGLILNRLRRDVPTKRLLVEALQQCFPGITDFSVQIDSATVQIFLEEARWSLPATRLSDGTMRWLALLALLLDPKPPPLIVIEEPELGLHPDLIRSLGELLRRASERTQLIVTTHSGALLDTFSDTPDVVLVCEREQGSTSMRRLERDVLADWLKDYSVGSTRPGCASGARTRRRCSPSWRD